MFTRSRVETEPATVQPVHNEFLLCRATRSLSSHVRKFLWRLNLVSARTFRLTQRGSLWLPANSFRLIKLSSRCFACARSLSIHVVLLARQAALAAQRRSELRHHLLRDVSASDTLFVSSSRYFQSSLHLCVYHRNGGVGVDFHASVLQAPRISKGPNNISRFQRSSLFRLRMLRHNNSSAWLLTKCSPVLVPSSQFTASFCCGPVVLCGLNTICSPNAAIC